MFIKSKKRYDLVVTLTELNYTDEDQNFKTNQGKLKKLYCNQFVIQHFH